MPKKEGEDTDQIVLDLAKECGVEMFKGDISISYRLTTKNSTTPSVIVRMIYTEKKVELMKAKKVLKMNKKKCSLMRNNPLTAKMFYTLRKDPIVSASWTVDGRLHCKATVGGKELKVVIDTPDYLFHLGYSEEKMGPFYV